jgi:hypothetical protein
LKEIGDLLANNLSLDEEVAVQEELQALQIEAVGSRMNSFLRCLIFNISWEMSLVSNCLMFLLRSRHPPK